MSILQSVVLGIVQGAGEFLPISSTAHLIIVPWLLKWPAHTLAFDVALHAGTLLAVLVFFLKDWIRLIIAGFRDGLKSSDGRQFWLIIVATIPGALIGKFLEEKAETVFRAPLLIACAMAVMGLVLFFVDRYALKNRDLKTLTLGSSLIIGLSQAFAIIPGFSRSGVTMTAGRWLGFDRESSARFSFLLSTPIIAGAVLLKFKPIIHQMHSIEFLVGILVSAVVGFISIGFLMKFLKKGSFAPFMVYRMLFAILVIGVFILRSRG